MPWTDEEISVRWAAAREAWPTVHVELELYADYVRERLPADAHIGRWHTADLYLACACARSDSAALAALERAYFPALAAALHHFDSGQTRDEVIQLLRERLFVAEGKGDTGKITRYTGRGSMVSWLRVAAVRTAISLKRRQKREVPFDGEALERVPDLTDDPEFAHLKGTYRAKFKAAFETALAELTPRQRTLLRLHLIDGLSIDQLGELHGVHRATCARWLKDIREGVGLRTKDLLKRDLDVNTGELDSILRLIDSRLDVSICRHLASGAD